MSRRNDDHEIGNYNSGSMYMAMALVMVILFIAGLWYIAVPLAFMALTFRGVENEQSDAMKDMGALPKAERPTGARRAVPPIVSTVLIIVIVIGAIAMMGLLGGA